MGKIFSICVQSNVDNNSDLPFESKDDHGINDTQATNKDLFFYEQNQISKSIPEVLKVNQSKSNDDLTFIKEIKEINFLISSKIFLNGDVKVINHEDDSKNLHLNKLSSLFVNVKEFSAKLLEEINTMRACPEDYSRIIWNHFQFLVLEDSHYYYKNGNISIALNVNEIDFRNCVNRLKITKPLNRLDYDEEIRVVCPDKISNQANYKCYVDELRRNNINRNIGFNFDMALPITQLVVVLQLVDDCNHNGLGSKRNNLLSQEFTKVGISIKKSKDKLFCIYLTFSDEIKV